MPGTFDDIRERLTVVQKHLSLSNKQIEVLTSPSRLGYSELEVEGETFPAWRILHSQALGPGKGGIRFHPQVDEDEVRSLAFWMALKTSLLGLPYGGAKGGVRVNPKGRSPQFLESLSRAYVRAFAKDLGAWKDVPAPDVYTTPQVMAWMLDEHERIIGQHEPAMITGKPLTLNGCELRGDATAKGGYIVVKELVQQAGLDSKSLTVAVQGFGNAGAHITRMLADEGMQVVAVSDSKGGVYDPDGLDVAEVSAIKEKEGSVSKYTKGRQVSNEELLTLKVDILVLAALENQVTNTNAEAVQARYIIELANGPVDAEADAILFKKGVAIVPDILANAGGVVVSYFEWAQNLTGSLFEVEYLENQLHTKMISAWQQVVERARQYENAIDYRTAAYLLAVQRILAAEAARGRV